MLRRDGFSSESGPIDLGEAAGKPDCPTSGVILTRGKGTLQDLFSIYPKAASSFKGSIRAANLDKGIKGTDFQSKKERILILYYLFENYKNLNAKQIRSLGDAVLINRDKKKTLELLKSFSKEERTGWFSVILGGKKALLSKEEAMWRNAHNYASSISDVRFLSYLKTIPATAFLHNAAVECEETAYHCLTTQLDSLVSGICQQIISIQKDGCDVQLQREVKSEEEKELKVSRVEFVHKIEDLCRERSRSCVVYSSFRWQVVAQHNAGVTVSTSTTLGRRKNTISPRVCPVSSSNRKSVSSPSARFILYQRQERISTKPRDRI